MRSFLIKRLKLAGPFMRPHGKLLNRMESFPTNRNCFHGLANVKMNFSHHPFMSELSFAESFSTSVGDSDLTKINEDNGSSQKVSEVIALASTALEVQSLAKSIITIERAVGEFCEAFDDLQNDSERYKVLLHLADQNVNRKTVHDLTESYSKLSLDDKSLTRVEEQLRISLVPPYIKLFQKIGQLPGGVKFLVDLRSHLNTMSSVEDSQAGTLKTMNSQLKQLLSHWFSVGFLDLEQVTWNSSCALLQKISEYEAVHPIRNWTDLKSRVGAYRRCFVYTHKSMPGEPIVVLHVGLMEDIPSKISSVVKNHRLVKKFSIDHGIHQSNVNIGREGEDEAKCKAAIFYSITSTQTGLQGIELGTYLIKQAVKSLKEELPELAHFSSLSPIPGFRTWLMTVLHTAIRKEKPPSEILLAEEANQLVKILQCNQKDLLVKFHDILKNNQWIENNDIVNAFEEPLMRLCALYLYNEKRRRGALDSVANFHLRNGAVMWRINWRGDFSIRGLQNSFGIMVNYKYFLDQLEENSSAYQEFHTIKATEKIITLANSQ